MPIPQTTTSEYNILILCEGQEEYYYLKKLVELNTFSEKYSIELDNAEGNGNLVPKYIYAYQQDKYDVILIFCDTDRAPFEDFLRIKDKLQTEFIISDSLPLIIFSNPCTMQIVLLHFDNTIRLRTQNKQTNRDTIFNLTQIQNYDAKKDQVLQLASLINLSNYNYMKTNVSALSINYNETSSTNFLKFLNNIENNDFQWIEMIEQLLDS